jgi:hypothetical protein
MNILEDAHQGLNSVWHTSTLTRGRRAKRLCKVLHAVLTPRHTRQTQLTILADQGAQRPRDRLRRRGRLKRP